MFINYFNIIQIINIPKSQTPVYPAAAVDMQW